MKLFLYRWLKRFFEGRWNRAYWYFVEKVYEEIERTHGTQSNQAWGESYKRPRT